VPATTTPLIGRVDERAELARRLADPTCRLLPIVGPGGIGKTRLARQALADQQAGFLHGAYFVPLASVSSAELLISAIASAVGFTFYRGDDPKAELLNYLREKELLLLLDNFEQLIDVGADLLAEILLQAPELKLLVTSRERLQLHGEWLLELLGLRVPPRTATEAIESYSAVQLFIARAQRIQANFVLSSVDEQAVVRICRLVEGMPLGIELAAAWVRVLACAEIAREIETSLDFLSTALRDVPARQRSLRAVFDHSWRLLTERERAVFQRLAVFQGGFTRSAATAVCAELKIENEKLKNGRANPSILNRPEGTRFSILNLLASLVDKSLLRRSPAGRYELHELVRQYAAEKLQADAAQTRDLHCAYYAEFLGHKTEPLKGSEQQRALEEIGAEIENVRAAWQWAVAHRKVDALGQSLESLYRYYDIGGWFQEGASAFAGAITVLDRADSLIVEDDRQQRVVLGQLLSRRAWFCSRLGQYEQAETLWQRSLVLFRESTSDVRREIALALIGLGYLGVLSGEYPQARSRSHEALAIFQAIGDQHGIADAFNNLGIVAVALGEYQEAKQYYQENLALHKALGDRKGIARALHNLSDTLRLLGEYQEARGLSQECLEVARAIGDHLLEAYSLACLGIVTNALGEHAIGMQFLQAGLDLCEAISFKAGVELCYNQIGILVSAAGDYQEAERYFLKALKLADELRAAPELLDVLTGLATNLARAGEIERPLDLLAVVAAHPASYQHTRESAEQLRAELRAGLPPEVAGSAHEGASARGLAEVVAELLGGH
jgi:predicted ATPase